MRSIFTVIFFFLLVSSKAQINHSRARGPVELSDSTIEGGAALFISNYAYCPISIHITLWLTNLNFSRGEQRVFIIPARTIKHKLGNLTEINSHIKNTLSYDYDYTYGNILIPGYDTSYQYDLPYGKGKTFSIVQGYNDRYSHKHLYALDFRLSKGTEVLAAREGIVIYTEDRGPGACPSEECLNDNNLVWIYHSDGTIGMYQNIAHKGARVKNGDIVKKGALIAISGNSTKASQLHFACVIPGITNTDEYVPTKFRINNGDTAVYLKSKESYLRNY